MKKLGLFIATAILGATSLTAQADKAWSLQYSMYGADNALGTADINAIEASYRTDEIIDVENVSLDAFFGIGVGDDNGVEIDNILGVEANYTHELNDGFSVNGLVGVARYKVSFPGGSDSDSELFFGFGGNYDLGSGTIFAEWRDIGDIDGIDIGYRMPF